MRILQLDKDPNVYTCNVYYIRGDWNTLDDVNTLIDTGSNDFIMHQLESFSSTGVGKRKVEQVILTHEHFDHAAGLKYVIKKWNPRVFAFAKNDGVTDIIKKDSEVKIGDNNCMILHTPGHSHDSISVYCPKEKVLFCGDLQVDIHRPDVAYTKEYFETLDKLRRLDIKTLFSGHDNPKTGNITEIIQRSFDLVKKARIMK